MKKFSKILVLLLAVIVIMTAFTVTILAAEGETETVANRDHGTYDNGMSTIYAGSTNDETGMTTSSWEKDEVLPGYYVTNGHTITRKGYIYVGLGEDGKNKYITFCANPSKGDTSNSFMWDPTLTGFPKVTVDGTSTYKYNLKDYSYVVLDFDACSPTGKLGAGLCNIAFRGALNGKTNGNYSLTIKSDDYYTYLDETAYNWQHVTIVAKFVPELDPLTGVITKAVFEIDVYVDGEFKKSYSQDVTSKVPFSTEGGALPVQVGFYNIRMSTNNSGGTWMVDGYDGSTYKYSDVTTWPGYDAATGTYLDPALWCKEQLAIDQMTVHYYQSGWNSTEIAADRFDAKTYEYPFGISTAKVGDVLYDDIDKAIAAAEAGGTVQLLTDISEIVTVEKAVVIDTNKYDAEGKATGEFYAFEYTSQNFLANTAEGKLTFVDAGEMTADIYWDFCSCDHEEGEAHTDACDCLCVDPEFPGHLMYLESKGVLGTTAVYTGEVPTFEIINGKKVAFAGWSREPGGEIASLEITAEDVENTFVIFYPVYEIINYTFEVTDTTGAVSYYTAEEFVDMVGKTPKNSTVKLLRDFVTETAWTTNVPVILDLNGYDYYRYGETSGTAFSFTDPGSDSTFVIMSSKPGSDLYNVAVSATGTASYGKWFYHAQPKCRMSVQIGGTVNEVKSESLNFYGGAFFYDEDGRNSRYYSFTAENANFYEYGAAIFFDNRTNINVTFTNCTIDTGSASFTRHASKGGVNGVMTFVNCDVYTNTIGEGYNNATVDNPALVFDNCRLRMTAMSGHYVSATAGSLYGPMLLINGTKIVIQHNQAQINSTLGYIHTYAGYALQQTTETFSFNNNATSSFLRGEDGMPDFTVTHEQYTVPTSASTGPAFIAVVAKATVANWYDENGELVATTNVAIDGTAIPPVEYTYKMENDVYRNGKYVWGNKEGTEFYDLYIDGNASEYNFYAHKAIGENVDYVAGIKDARLSLVYYTQFHMVFYLPVVEGMEAPAVSGFNAPGTVYINDVQYWAYTTYCSTDGLFNNVAAAVTFTMDGKTYTQTFKVSGLLYAQIVLAAPESDAEALAVANMVRYVREALEAKEITTHDAAITALIGTANADGSTTGGVYSLPAYITEYPDVDAKENIENKLFGYAAEVRYGMLGSTPRFLIVLTDDAVAAGATVTFASNGKDQETRAEGNTIYTLNIRVYDIVHPMTITLTIPGVDGAEPTVITATYSIGAYLAANPDVEVVKAMYAFGVAAGDYRKTVK